MGLWDRMWAAGYEFLGTRAQKVEGPFRERIVADAPGDVLEVGAGNGFNFTHYRAATRVVAIEPDPEMRKRGMARVRASSVPISLEPGDALRLEFPDASFDTVIFSLVLCTIPDPGLALAEAKRVLRPGGEIRIYEHVRSSDPSAAQRQDRWLKPWRFVNRGCHPNRDTVAAIKGAGFTFTELEEFDLNERGVPKIVRPHALGVATPD